jgi:predicted MFS family arabinose efflux permease
VGIAEKPASWTARVPYGWCLVVALAITSTAGYGVLTYALMVFLVPMQQALDTSRTALTVAPAVSLLVSALVAVPIGRWLDRRGGRVLMVAGSILATVGLLAWSQVENVVQFYLVSVVLGVAGAAVLYEAAFAVVVPWFEGQQRATALLVITIVGGFASTIFLPLTGVLVEAYGWRRALVVLAVVYGVLTTPLHLLVRRAPARPRDHAVRPDAPPAADAASDTTGSTGPRVARDVRAETVRLALRDPAYWLIGAAFVAEGIGVFVISVHLVAYLGELGHPATLAATISGLLGVLSVTGRVVTTAVQRRFRLTSVVATIFVLQAMGLLLLPWIGGDVRGAVACVLAIGIGFGVATVAKPALLADRYGVVAYATLSGVLGAFLMTTKALAPLGAAWLHDMAGSYTPVMLICAVTGVLGALGLVVVGRHRVRTPAPDLVADRV